MNLIPCRECQRQVSSEALTCPHCGVIAPVLEHAKHATTPEHAISSRPELKIQDGSPMRLQGHQTQGKLVAALSEGQGQGHSRPARHGGPRGHPRRRRRGRHHPVFYLIGGLVLLIVIAGSLAQYTGSLAPYVGSIAPYVGSLAPYIGSLVQFNKSLEQRPEGKRTAVDAKAERELKESQSWAMAACQAAAREQLKAPSTASFVYDDVAWIENKKAYVKGSVDVPNGFRAKLRNRYACELAARGEGRWNVTKVVFESR